MFESFVVIYILINNVDGMRGNSVWILPVRALIYLSTIVLHLGGIFICLVLILYDPSQVILVNLGLLGDFWLINS